MKHFKSKLLAAAFATAVSTNAFADADIATGPADDEDLQATTNVDFCIVVPKILIFGVGALGSTVNKIEWTVGFPAGVADNADEVDYTGAPGTFTSPAPFDDVSSAITRGDRGTAGGDGEPETSLQVFVFSNSGGDVTIEASFAGGEGGEDGAGTDLIGPNGFTIPFEDITITNADGTASGIPHPADLGTANAATVPHTDGIVNLADDWQYTYEIPTDEFPVAGTYEGRITYVATVP